MPTEIHVVVTPAGILAGFVGLLVFAAFVFLGGVLAVMWPQRSAADEFEDAEARVECAETEELPRRSGPRTAPTIHAPQYRRSDDDTVVIEQAGARS
ncbi:hypothetical protein AB0J14_04385 [Micromonospora arborensis]|uniref:hypothetical protein n=1 Tax=Micromonospora arborensis TaxID=2116518 RepID=UPI0033F85D22